MDQQFDDLTLRIDQINRARRHLEHSVDASGIALRRSLHAGGEKGTGVFFALGSVKKTPVPFSEDTWPRVTKARSRVYPRIRAVVLLSVVAALLAVSAQRGWTVVQAARRGVAAERAVPSPPAASVERPSANVPFVIHVRTTRPCRVRIVVDGTIMDWRQLKEGDEFVSRPTREIRIESDDTAALAATVNGKSIRIEDVSSLFQHSAK